MDSPSPCSSPLRTAALALLLAAAGFGFLRSLEEALAGFDRRASRAGPPLTWRLGKAPVVALARCLDAARPLLPPGSLVAFAGPAEPEDQRLLRWRWASYLLPERDLVQYPGASGAGGAETAGDPSHVVACRRDLAGDPRVVEVARLPGGRLYRVRRQDPPENGR